MRKFNFQEGCRFAEITKINKSGESSIWTILPDSRSYLTVLLMLLVEFCFAFAKTNQKQESEIVFLVDLIWKKLHDQIRVLKNSGLS